MMLRVALQPVLKPRPDGAGLKFTPLAPFGVGDPEPHTTLRLCDCAPGFTVTPFAPFGVTDIPL